MKLFAFLLLLAICGSTSNAALIPYYRMDSLAYLSSDIVLCDEVRYVKKLGERSDEYEATFTVVQSLKGTCRPKQQLTVTVDSDYTRVLYDSFVDFPQKPPAIPMGRALLFLTKERDEWRLVTGGMKLVINGETHCYCQVDNPGPLYLARMAPENIQLPATTPYSEERLLTDLDVALKKAQAIKKATFGDYYPIRENP